MTVYMKTNVSPFLNILNKILICRFVFDKSILHRELKLLTLGTINVELSMPRNDIDSPLMICSLQQGLHKILI